MQVMVNGKFHKTQVAMEEDVGHRTRRLAWGELEEHQE